MNKYNKIIFLDRKGILHMPENVGFLTPKRNSYIVIDISHHEIDINLVIKVDFKSIHVFFPSFIPFQSEQPTKRYIMGIKKKWPIS